MRSQDDARFESELREAAKCNSTTNWLHEAVIHDSGPERELPCVFGKYELLTKLGGGNMGAVYKATQRDMDRLVALKVIKPGGRGDKLRKRFLREIRATKLEHNHLGKASRSQQGTVYASFVAS